MPKYSYLSDRLIEPTYIEDLLSTHALVGVPYSEEMITEAKLDFVAQADPNADTEGLTARYPGAVISNFDAAPGVTEMDALVAYLQVLGTMVDFSTFTPETNR